jgi:hypothetical protein
MKKLVCHITLSNFHSVLKDNIDAEAGDYASILSIQSNV